MRLVKGLLDRCVDVTELLAGASGPLRLSDIAQQLDLPKSAAHRLLRELCDRGWMEQVGIDGPYRLTLRFGLLGGRVLRASGLLENTQPLLDQLAVRTRELARLTVVTGHALSWLSSAQGAPPGLMYQPTMDGAPVLHATANGKAFLATFDDATALRIARSVGLGVCQPTPRTVADETALARELTAVRQRGYGLADQEAEMGVTAVAVAIRGRSGIVRGTVSVAGPSLRFPPARIPELAKQLNDTAAALGEIWPEATGTEPS